MFDRLEKDAVSEESMHHGGIDEPEAATFGISKNIWSRRTGRGRQETPIPCLTVRSYTRKQSRCKRTWDTGHGDKAVVSCQWSVRKGARAEALAVICRPRGTRDFYCDLSQR